MMNAVWFSNPCGEVNAAPRMIITAQLPSIIFHTVFLPWFDQSIMKSVLFIFVFLLSLFGGVVIWIFDPALGLIENSKIDLDNPSNWQVTDK
ncbi:hypothetical protein EON65_55185 [archaeon]|nr:MAG: hypothetical protein EON65_55185 [archaeon]